MNRARGGAVSAPRPQVSLFEALEDLERAASRLPSTVDYAAHVANKYLGLPAVVSGAEATRKDPDDSSVINRLIALTQGIDGAVSQIEYNLNRLSE